MSPTKLVRELNGVCNHVVQMRAILERAEIRFRLDTTIVHETALLIRGKDWVWDDVHYVLDVFEKSIDDIVGKMLRGHGTVPTQKH